MRVLALDIGSKRVGVAVSDALGHTAQPLATLARADLDGDAAVLRKMIRDYEVGKIVVGMPITLGGARSAQTRATDKLTARLRKVLDLPVDTWDERLTTKIADASMIEAGASRKTRREKRDMIAAAVILQSYLDRSRGEPTP